MGVADDIQDLADACGAGAHQLLDAIVALGPRPAETPADLTWDETSTRLHDQLDHLTAMARNLSADAVKDALADHAGDLRTLGEVTGAARESIRRIADVSRLLTTLSKVLDVGLAVLALASAPSPEAVTTLVDKIGALGDDLSSAGPPADATGGS